MTNTAQRSTLTTVTAEFFNMAILPTKDSWGHIECFWILHYLYLRAFNSTQKWAELGNRKLGFKIVTQKNRAEKKNRTAYASSKISAKCSIWMNEATNCAFYFIFSVKRPLLLRIVIQDFEQSCWHETYLITSYRPLSTRPTHAHHHDDGQVLLHMFAKHDASTSRGTVLVVCAFPR